MALAQGTAFTYQGRLGADGAAAIGYYDLRFELFGTESNPFNAFGTFTTNHVAVANGLFTVRLDFGSAWDGTDRWLEIAVKTNGAATFTTLSPRQKVTPTPYAIRASNADGMSWSGLSGVPVGAGLSLGGGNTFNVNFGASGAAATAARSDHDHFGQSWLGTGAAGLTLVNQDVGPSRAILGLQGGGTPAFLPNVPSGVAGVTAASLGYGVIGASTGDAIGGVYGMGKWEGVFGYASQGGLDVWGIPAIGVFGSASGTDAIGVMGKSTATTGLGLGVSGQSDSPDGTGVFGLHNSTSGTSAGVQGVTKSLTNEAVAVLGVVDTTTPGIYSAGVRGINRGTNYPGIGVYGSQDGFGFGVLGRTPQGVGVVGNSTEGTGVWGYSYGVATNVFSTYNPLPGVGVMGDANALSGPSIGVQGNAYSAEGVGVSGYGWLGTGVQGSNHLGYQASLAAPAAAITASAPDATNTAVRIERGALQVVGAGVGTPTPAFIHVANGTNTSTHITTLYHPLCDGDPNAILIVTPNYNAGPGYNAHPVGVWFNGVNWTIFNQDTQAMPGGVAFNVLVIKP